MWACADDEPPISAQSATAPAKKKRTNDMLRAGGCDTALLVGAIAKTARIERPGGEQMPGAPVPSPGRRLLGSSAGRRRIVGVDGRIHEQRQRIGRRTRFHVLLGPDDRLLRIASGPQPKARGVIGKRLRMVAGEPVILVASLRKVPVALGALAAFAKQGPELRFVL